MPNCTKEFRQIPLCRGIPMNLLGRESCSAEASMIPEFHLHCTISEFAEILLYNLAIHGTGWMFHR